MKSASSVLASGLFLGLLTLPFAAHGVPASKARVTLQGNHCVRIATAGVDHGKEVAQKFADDLLAADIEAFKKKKGLKSVRIKRRFKKCKKHLWFFGQEYNCTSLAVACW